MLEYDNSAFYYFALTLLTIYLIPGTWYAFSEVYCALIKQTDPSVKARTALENDKAAKLKNESTGVKRLSKWPFIINFIILIITYALFFYLISLVSNDGEVSRFDPYQILGIEMGISTGEIKKAYRKLSLKYHPDKNSGDKFAEEMFMKVAKAYESLTDETSRENYEKFGNPDGKQALEVSIGLPKMILDNPKIVLVFYLIAMVVLIPAAVGLWYANSKQYGEKNVMYETYNAFYHLLTENHRIKMMPEVMAISAECRKINIPQEENKEIVLKLYSRMKSDKLMHKPKYEQPNILTGNLLLHAHCMRMTDMLNPSLSQNLEKMLLLAPDLIDGMIEVSHQRAWLQTTISCIRFSQCLIQCLWHTDHSLLQLPHFTESEVKHVVRGSKVQAKTLSDYLRVEDAEKKGLAKFSEEQKQDVFNACQLLPRIKVEWKMFVEEDDDTESVQGVEEDETALPTVSEKKTSDAIPEISGDTIYEKDLVTLRVTITRENVTEGGSTPPVYAPYFPRPLREAWWIILTEKPKGTDKKKDSPTDGTMYCVEKISEQGRVITHEIRFMAPGKTGEYAMDLYILSDCYMGLDEEFEVKYTVYEAVELPEYEPHKEDLELDNDPTLFEMMMTAGADDSSDDDDDEDDEDLTEVQKKRNEQRKLKKENNNNNNNMKENDTAKVVGDIVEEAKGSNKKREEEDEDDEEEEEEDEDES